MRQRFPNFHVLLLFCAIFFAAHATCAETKKPPRHPININKASSAQLQEVPGIGPSTAAKILKMRKANGKFKSVDELRAIKGIGKKKLDKWRPYLTVGTDAGEPAASSAEARRKLWSVHFQKRWWVGRRSTSRGEAIFSGT
jgi:comEA protein